MTYPPPLPSDEQIALCLQAQAGDIAARNRLVETTMHYVQRRAYARRNVSRGTDHEDLVSEGALGVLRAIETFDASRGFRFLTYAAAWIDHFILARAYADRDLRRSETSHGSKIVRDFQALRGRGISRDEALATVAAQHDYPIARAAALVAALTRAAPRSLEQRIRGNHYGRDVLLADLIADPSSAPVAELLDRHRLCAVVRDIIACFRRGLTAERDLAILDRRILADAGEEETLKELGEAFGVSRERIRQLEVLLLADLRAMLQASREVQEVVFGLVAVDEEQENAA